MSVADVEKNHILIKNRVDGPIWFQRTGANVYKEWAGVRNNKGHYVYFRTDGAAWVGARLGYKAVYEWYFRHIEIPVEDIEEVGVDPFDMSEQEVLMVQMHLSAKYG